MAQSVRCLTADPGVASSILAWSDTPTVASELKLTHSVKMVCIACALIVKFSPYFTVSIQQITDWRHGIALMDVTDSSNSGQSREIRKHDVACCVDSGFNYLLDR